MATINADEIKSSILRRNRHDLEKNFQKKQIKLRRNFFGSLFFYIPAVFFLIVGVETEHTADSAALIIIGVIFALYATIGAVLRREILEYLLVPGSSDEDLLKQINFEEFLLEYNNQKSHIGHKYMAQLDNGGAVFVYPEEIAIINRNMSKIVELSMNDIRDVYLEPKGADDAGKSVFSDGLLSPLIGAMIGRFAFGDAGTIAGAVVGSSHNTSNAASESVTALSRKNRVTIYTRKLETPSISLLFAEVNSARDIYGLISEKLEVNKKPNK